MRKKKEKRQSAIQHLDKYHNSLNLTLKQPL